MTIFRSNYFHLKLSFFNFFKNNCYIYANVFKIFKFELNPLDNKKRYKPLCTFQDIFRTFQVNFQDISVTPVVGGSYFRIFPELSTGGVNISVSAHETESGNCSEKGHKDKRQLTPSQREV
jgi:hypothetical protein